MAKHIAYYIVPKYIFGATFLVVFSLPRGAIALASKIATQILARSVSHLLFLSAWCLDHWLSVDGRTSATSRLFEHSPANSLLNS
jgi:hypothetical protein